MTEFEERLLKIIFDKDREDAGIHLYNKTTMQSLRSNLGGLSSFTGKRKNDNGRLFIKFDSSDVRYDFCVKLSDIVFCGDDDVCLPLSRVEEIISEKNMNRNEINQ